MSLWYTGSKSKTGRKELKNWPKLKRKRHDGRKCHQTVKLTLTNFKRMLDSR